MIIIPGGTDFLGRHFDDFMVGDEHTVFDWCKVCVDQNPNEAAPYYLSATVEDREIRLTTLGASGSNVAGARPHPFEIHVGDDDETDPPLTLWDDKAAYRIQNTIYQQLAERIRTGRIEYKPVYLDDLPGELDQTLCVIGKDPVLDIAERVDCCGRAIADLLFLRQAASCAAPALDSPGTTATAETEPDPIERLAEWIYTQHSPPKPLSYDSLWTLAVGIFEPLKKTDFRKAYRRVYDSHPWRPPATGWPLKAPYKERWSREHS